MQNDFYFLVVELDGLTYNIAFLKLINFTLSYSKAKIYLNTTQKDVLTSILVFIQQVSLRIQRQINKNIIMVLNKKLLTLTTLQDSFVKARQILNRFINNTYVNSTEEMSSRIIQILFNFTTLLSSFGKFSLKPSNDK